MIHIATEDTEITEENNMNGCKGNEGVLTNSRKYFRRRCRISCYTVL